MTKPKMDLSKLSPMRVIRAKCLDCSNELPNEVRLCAVEECPLFAYRFGTRPETAAAKGHFVGEKYGPRPPERNLECPATVD